MRVALIGLPNCGKTALFNRLTGSRQKVANYPGVTVERKEGVFADAKGARHQLLDLPGLYSFKPTTLDEAITRDVALGRLSGELRPELIVLVADATHLSLSLRLALEARRLGLPMILAINRSDIARRRGFQLDLAALSRELGIPVVETVATRTGGADALVSVLEQHAWTRPGSVEWQEPTAADVIAAHREVARLLEVAHHQEPARSATVATADRLLLHPIFGMLSLAVILFLVFQAVFSWASLPMDMIDAGVARLGGLLATQIPDGPLRSLLIDGVIAGIGSVVVFLPQILILFAFILVLEDSGYLPRAAIPSIRDRIATIMVAPLMTCSARLPVYALLIAAFIPDRAVGIFNLQGLVLFGLYFAGIISALLVAYVIKRWQGASDQHLLMLELPDYQWPNPLNLLVGLYDRTRIFLERVGGIILAMVVLLWFLSTYPAPPLGATAPAIEYSFAGQIGKALAVVLEPIGFNWQIAIALVPGLAAREIAVGALGTVYALSGSEEAVTGALATTISTEWSLATALALLAWYVFAPQCLATLAVVKRETGGWRHPLTMAVYLFALAYLAAFVTYRLTLILMGA
ncbi:MAG: ferrous iron transporter B [Acidibacter sp.]|nr:ferrous iron transporter B [Acidibacter sp.]